MRVLIIVALGVALAGCASSSSDITAESEAKRFFDRACANFAPRRRRF
jgi:hypothetical protein